MLWASWCVYEDSGCQHPLIKVQPGVLRQLPLVNAPIIVGPLAGLIVPGPDTLRLPRRKPLQVEGLARCWVSGMEIVSLPRKVDIGQGLPPALLLGRIALKLADSCLPDDGLI